MLPAGRKEFYRTRKIIELMEDKMTSKSSIQMNQVIDGLPPNSVEGWFSLFQTDRAQRVILCVISFLKELGYVHESRPLVTT